MEYGNDGKRKAEGDLRDYKNLKKNIASCVEVLSKDYFDMCLRELGESLNNGFTRINSQIFDVNAKLKVLENNFKSLSKTSEVKIVRSDNLLTDKGMMNTTINSGESDSSLEILSVTPSKECSRSQKKKTNIDIQIKNYGMLLDTEKMGRKKKDEKSDRYDPFALANVNDASWLDSWMKIDRVTVNLDTIKADKHFFVEIIEPQVWLHEDHIDVGMSLLRKKLAKVPCPFHSDKLAFLDVQFTKLISKNYQKFLENPINFDWCNEFISYYNGFLPKCARTNKRLGADVDDVYVVLNIKNVHWIALAISIQNSHIDVYDSIISLFSDEEVEDFVKPYASMLPYLFRALASPAEQENFNLAEYTITMCKGIPQNIKTGDCGIYAMKYIECLALDADMKSGLCDANIKDIRKKLATDMFVGANHWGDS